MEQNPAEAMELCAPGEMGEAEVRKAPPWLGFWEVSRRRLPPDDPFFAAGDMERELLAKHVRTPFPPLGSFTSVQRKIFWILENSTSTRLFRA